MHLPRPRKHPAVALGENPGGRRAFFRPNERVPPSERVPRAWSPAELPSLSGPTVPVPPARGRPTRHAPARDARPAVPPPATPAGLPSDHVSGRPRTSSWRQGTRTPARTAPGPSSGGATDPGDRDKRAPGAALGESASLLGESERPLRARRAHARWFPGSRCAHRPEAGRVVVLRASGGPALCTATGRRPSTGELQGRIRPRVSDAGGATSQAARSAPRDPGPVLLCRTRRWPGLGQPLGRQRSPPGAGPGAPPGRLGGNSDPRCPSRGGQSRDQGCATHARPAAPRQERARRRL